MKKRNARKGFTIVELVIVIAVIAILAAVLIPTFSGVVEKAQISADKQAAVNTWKELYAINLADGVCDAKEGEDTMTGFPTGVSYTAVDGNVTFTYTGTKGTYTWTESPTGGTWSPSI